MRKIFIAGLLCLFSMHAMAEREPLSDQENAERYRAADDDGAFYAASGGGNNIAYMGVQDFGGGNVKFIFRLRNNDNAASPITVKFTQGVPSKSFDLPNGQEVWFTVPAVLSGDLVATAQFSTGNKTGTANFNNSIGKQVNIPIDGGLGILMLAGLGYGLYKRKEEQ
jgi:hypothetical protein